MILFIKQTKANFDMEWEISGDTSSRTAIAKAPFTRGKFETEIVYDDLKNRFYIITLIKRVIDKE